MKTYKKDVKVLADSFNDSVLELDFGRYWDSIIISKRSKLARQLNLKVGDTLTATFQKKR